MPTIIYFGTGDLSVTVAEEPEQVEEAFVQSDGRRPFKLKELGRSGDLYINPSRIAFWRGVQSEAPDPPHKSSSGDRLPVD